MKKQIALYSLTMAAAILMAAVSLTALGETKLAAPVIIVASVCLFVGSAIKLCRLSDRFKKFVDAALDLLFWLP